jgi:hypothetical protein
MPVLDELRVVVQIFGWTWTFIGFLLLGFVYFASQTVLSRWFSAAKKPAAKSAPTAGAATEEEADSAAAALLAELEHEEPDKGKKRRSNPGKSKRR